MSDTTTPPAPNSNRSDAVPGGLQDDPGASALQEGDFGLDGDLRATMLAALEQKWNADDPGATTLDDDTADPATSQPSPAPPSPTTGEDGAGAGEGAAPVDPDPGTPPATPDARDSEFSLDEYARAYFGTNLDREQARNLFATLNGLQNLTPAQRAELDRVLAGGQPNQYPATQGQPVQAPVTQPGAPLPPATPAVLPPRPDDEYEAQLYDKYIAPLAQTTQAQLASIQESIAQTTRAQQEAERQRIDAQVSQAQAAWRAEHPVLSDGEFDALTDRIIRAGIFPAIVNAHNGDAVAATRAVYEQHFWSDPDLRTRAIANISSGRAPGDPTTIDPTSPIAAQQSSDDAQRQARAASVAGGGGSTQPRGQAPIPKDAEGRRQALINELATQGDFS